VCTRFRTAHHRVITPVCLSRRRSEGPPALLTARLSDRSDASKWGWCGYRNSPEAEQRVKLAPWRTTPGAARSAAQHSAPERPHNLLHLCARSCASGQGQTRVVEQLSYYQLRRETARGPAQRGPSTGTTTPQRRPRPEISAHSGVPRHFWAV